MQFLHLDSYYFYAPIPRALQLREKLKRASVNSYKLLYMQFSSPSHFLKSLTRVITGKSITSVTMLTYSTVANRERSTLKPLENLLKTMLRPLLSGRRRSKTINMLHLARLIGEEQAAILDFLIFLYTHAERAESVIAEGACDAGVELRVPRHVAKQLQRLPAPESLAQLIRQQVSLYNMYTGYMACRVCRLLGLSYPHDMNTINKLDNLREEDLTMFLSTRCPQCNSSCPPEKHRDDIARAITLYKYAAQRHGHKIVIASIESVKKPPRDENKRECFSCLADCLASLLPNIDTIM